MFVAQMGLGHNRLRSRLQSREAESFILKTLGGVDLLLFFFLRIVWTWKTVKTGIQNERKRQQRKNDF